MSWKLSKFRAGDLVEVRGPNEIFETLDENGMLEGLPFMPEMLQYCGQRYRVSAVAHKACDMIGQLGTARRLNVTVHLEALRCDGSAHGACQAECNLFWKDAWLKPADSAPIGKNYHTHPSGRCTESRLHAVTIHSRTVGKTDVVYACQATLLYAATRWLPWWDVRQYVFDIITRNRTPHHVCRVLLLATLRSTLRRLPFGYRLFKKFHDLMHRKLTARDAPSLNGRIPKGMPTPTPSLELQPGELVRIKTQAEIEQTIDTTGRNRGLTFDPEEMAPYCGKTFKVRKRVTTIIEERTGRMLYMKQPCIMLEGVVCKAEYVLCRLNCPRAIPSYWREVWLERVEADREHPGPE
jgi:hypothetical protein